MIQTLSGTVALSRACDLFALLMRMGRVCDFVQSREPNVLLNTLIHTAFLSVLHKSQRPSVSQVSGWEQADIFHRTSAAQLSCSQCVFSGQSPLVLFPCMHL